MPILRLNALEFRFDNHIYFPSLTRFGSAQDCSPAGGGISPLLLIVQLLLEDIG